MSRLAATHDLRPFRPAILRSGDAFPADDDWGSAGVALPEWGWSAGFAGRHAIWLAAVDADGARVKGATATLEVLAFTRPEQFGFPVGRPRLRHTLALRAGLLLDKPLVLDLAAHDWLVVRVTALASFGTAQQVGLAVQVKP